MLLFVFAAEEALEQSGGRSVNRGGLCDDQTGGRRPQGGALQRSVRQPAAVDEQQEVQSGVRDHLAAVSAENAASTSTTARRSTVFYCGCCCGGGQHSVDGRRGRLDGVDQIGIHRLINIIITTI